MSRYVGRRRHNLERSTAVEYDSLYVGVKPRRWEDLPKDGDVHEPSQIPTKSSKEKKVETKKGAGTENKKEPLNEKQWSGDLTEEGVSLDKSKKKTQPKKKTEKNKSNENQKANAEKSPDAEEKHVAAADDKASKPAVWAKTKRKKKTEPKRKGGMNKQVKQENVPVAEETRKQKMDEVEVNKKDGIIQVPDNFQNDGCRATVSTWL
uniref:Uncharacterized protein n=1 Tax=Trichuris muris TaxID=70415 RepID=A0A5S6Q6M9_TRIMR